MSTFAAHLRLAAGLLALALPARTGHAAPPRYAVVRTIPLGAPDHWDYLLFDAAAGRVLAAHSDHTDIVDPNTGHILGRLAGLAGAHGQAIVPHSRVIYADSGQTGRITLFDGASFKPIATLPAGAGADAVIYEPTRHLIAVMDGEQAAMTLIDAARQTVRATVALGGEPESAAADGAGHIYVDLASTGRIAVVDAATARLATSFPLPGCQSPTGLAIDPNARRLFVSCRNAVLMVVDPDHARVLQTLPIGRGTDAAAFDPNHRLVFSSNGAGTLSVSAEHPDGSLDPPAEIPTAPGARTMAEDPASGRVFLVTADPAGPAPPPGTRPSYRPGSVKLLVLEPRPSMNPNDLPAPPPR